jgi:hypothetical protein
MTARGWVGPILGSLVAMAACYFVVSRTMGPAGSAMERVAQLRWWLTIPARRYFTWNVGVFLVAVFPFAPLLIAALLRRRVAIAVAAAAVGLVIVLHFSLDPIPSPLPDWQTWSLQDIGVRAMIGGSLAPSSWSLRITPALRVIGIVTLAALCVAVLARKRQPGGSILVSLGLLNLMLVNVFWFYNDRYYLPLAPTVAYLAVGLIGDERRAKIVAGALLSVWAMVAFTGTRDMLEVNDACRAAARQLEQTGTPPWDIDAGYASNGWRLYAHPEHMAPGADRRFEVPGVTSQQPTTYWITNVPQAGFDVVRVIALEHAWWQVTDRLYVLRAQDPGPRP